MINAFAGFLSTLYAVLAVAPFVTFAAVWFAIWFMMKDKKVTTRIAMDITNFFLLGSVSLMWNRLFHTQFGFWLIMLVLLIAFGMIGGYQTRMKGKSDLIRAGRVVWRFSFLGLSVLYVLLFIIHIGKNFFFVA